MARVSALLFLSRALRLVGIVVISFAFPARAGAEAPAARPACAVPDVELLNQDGKKVKLYSDLVKGRVVALSFVFTSCPTICSSVGVNMGQLRKELGASWERDIALISISIDPVTDTPAKLKAWAKGFGAGPGWSLLTGEKNAVTELLKKLQVYSPDLRTHSPSLLVVNDRTEEPGEPLRINALEVSPAKIATLLKEQAARRVAAAPAGVSPDHSPESPANSAAKRYFTDVTLINQDGKPLRLYSDLLQDKVVLIDCFFSGCTGACKVTMPLFRDLQKKFAGRAGAKLHFLSISVDPAADTPETLRKFATGLEAKPGWDFLTGDKASVELALGKLGFATEDRDGHSNVILVGNLRTGLWKKLF